MKAIVRALTHKSIRSSATTNLRASGGAPVSGITASDNFEGASQASAEVLEGMNSAFEDIVIGDDTRGALNTQLQRLDDRASQFANSSLDFCESKEPWSCNRQEASLIALAWACAANVYDHGTDLQRDLEHAGTRLNVEWSLPASSLGSAKATTFTTYTPEPEASDNSRPAPYLTIAVRGSATKLDHIVNLNGDPRLGGDLFPDESIRINAHAGFLNSALRLLPLLSGQIEQRLRDTPSTTLLFTGHSAGGATATLLYLAFRSRFAKRYPNAAFTCITFGCPPVAKAISRQDENTLNQIAIQDNVINIMNEFDFVTRADSTYFRSLIQLYQHVDEAPSSAVWALPPQQLQHVGAVVVLRKEIPGFEIGTDAQGNTCLRLSAWKLTPESLAQVMFCRLSVHGRIEYQKRMAQIENGALSEHGGWS
ncbi:Alpha/Beta hydrolase protein [Clohesyomyces aquaticus]|uniref:Alpha/Beta hydrolase protein n=1 Tax=Clohesyomyces aquaticus TaxID=1231657 RepID=A0A1Y2A247_9PLEO|nr:Alpha/Beta hydrolase protein [Clohesyomyces aquaticus]